MATRAASSSWSGLDDQGLRKAVTVWLGGFLLRTLSTMILSGQGAATLAAATRTTSSDPMARCTRWGWRSQRSRQMVRTIAGQRASRRRFDQKPAAMSTTTVSRAPALTRPGVWLGG